MSDPASSVRRARSTRSTLTPATASTAGPGRKRRRTAAASSSRGGGGENIEPSESELTDSEEVQHQARLLQQQQQQQQQQQILAENAAAAAAAVSTAGPSSTSSTTESASDSASSTYAGSTSAFLRTTRLDEQKELQELNARLELYILKSRERENCAGGAELRFVREKAVKDLQEQKKSYEERLLHVREQKQKQATDIAHLNAENTKLSGEASSLNSQLSSAQKRISELELRIQHQNQDIEQVSARAISAEDEVKTLRADLIAAKAEVESLKRQLAEITARHEQLTSDLAVAQAQAANASTDLELLQTTSAQEINILKNQNDQLSKDHHEIEDRLRKEFGSQLKSILADRQTQYEEEKQAGIDDLKKFYEDKLAELRDQMESGTSEIETLTRRMVEVQRETHDEKTEAQRAIAAMDALENQIKTLQASLSSVREDYSKELFDKNQLIKTHLSTIKRKDEEFQTLMDVKIALDMEIKQYRMLLDNEEDRLGYQSPAQKTRSSFGLELQVFRTQHRIHLTNVSSSNFPLVGFTLRAVQAGEEFKFPSNLNLDAGESVSVVSGDHEDEQNPNEFGWSVTDQELWHQGETIELRDGDDAIVAQVRIL